MNETGGRSTKNWDIPNHQVFHDQHVTWRTFCAHVLEWKWIQSICNSTCLSKWSIVWRSGKIFGGWKWDRSIQRTPRIHAASLAIAKNKYIRSVRASNWGPIHQKTSENHFGIHFDKTCSAFFMVWFVSFSGWNERETSGNQNMLPLYGQEVTFVLLCPLTRKNRPFGSRFSMIFRPNSQPFSGHPTHPGSQALWLECVPGGIINRQLNQRTLTTIPDWRLISVFIIIISSSSSIILIIIII